MRLLGLGFLAVAGAAQVVGSLLLLGLLAALAGAAIHLTDRPYRALVDGNRPHRSPPPGVALIGRSTQQRAVVLGALLVAESFISVQALHKRLVADGSPVGLSTVTAR
ncbi:hypothetical protein ACFY2W_28580 [Streptomyces sp. NPDC001262]|uniref:hypothetical protein n=1 Tax=Streptomyces sp. NPDC001262 TaxID=3364552 RepID=UPI0036B88627